jgi:hypothetical protein
MRDGPSDSKVAPLTLHLILFGYVDGLKEKIGSITIFMVIAKSLFLTKKNSYHC